jgi:hypothetical protein
MCEGEGPSLRCSQVLQATTKPTTNDEQIRRQLKRDLISAYSGDPDTIMLEELGLRHGYCRIDLAVVNGSLHGFEIKSDRDTLRRLERQVDTYNKILDFVTLVTGRHHAEKALRVVPEWWGIKCAHIRGQGELQILDLRKASENPLVDKLAVAKLLWREEALALLEGVGAAVGFRSKPRRFIYSRLTEVVEIDQLRSYIRDRLRSRTDWRSGERQMSYGG